MDICPTGTLLGEEFMSSIFAGVAEDEEVGDSAGLGLVLIGELSLTGSLANNLGALGEEFVKRAPKGRAGDVDRASLFSVSFRRRRGDAINEENFEAASFVNLLFGLPEGDTVSNFSRLLVGESELENRLLLAACALTSLSASEKSSEAENSGILFTISRNVGREEGDSDQNDARREASER